MEKIKNLNDLYNVLKQVPEEYKKKYGVGTHENGFGLITEFQEDEDECEGLERYDKEIKMCPALKEIENYFDNIISEVENPENDDVFVTSEKKKIRCKHENIINLDEYGQAECLLCGMSLDISDPKMINPDGTVKKEAQEEWEKENEKRN